MVRLFADPYFFFWWGTGSQRIRSLCNGLRFLVSFSSDRLRFGQPSSSAQGGVDCGNGENGVLLAAVANVRRCASALCFECSNCEHSFQRPRLVERLAVGAGVPFSVRFLKWDMSILGPDAWICLAPVGYFYFILVSSIWCSRQQALTIELATVNDVPCITRD